MPPVLASTWWMRVRVMSCTRWPMTDSGVPSAEEAIRVCSKGAPPPGFRRRATGVLILAVMESTAPVTRSSSGPVTEERRRRGGVTSTTCVNAMQCKSMCNNPNIVRRAVTSCSGYGRAEDHSLVTRQW